MTETDYANVLRVPDRRWVMDKRDVALLGHADRGTIGRYAAVRPEHREELVERLDRRHQDARHRRA
ncbi:MAG: hypothetical protein WKF96_12430 [Solirubrobacteraceae bacterium]